MVGGLLDGAVDPEGLPLFARLVTPPTHALLVVGPDTGGVFVPGSYFFLPAGEAGFQGPSDFFGSDFLEFVAVDDGGLESPLVRLDVVVLPVNDAPTGESMTFSALEDFPLHVDPPGVLSTSFDADGDPLEVHLVSGPSWSSTPGTFTLGLDGYLDFLSPPNESGTYAFTFKLFDGTVDSELITSTIVVEPTPDLPIVNPDTYATDEDVPLFVSAADGLSSNDSDPDGDTLTCNIRTDPGNGVAFVALDCSLSYESTPDWNGIDSFLVDVSDGLSVVTSQVTISVRPVNDNPIALDDFYLMVSGDVLHANVLDNDADPDGDRLFMVLILGPTDRPAPRPGSTPTSTVSSTPRSTIDAHAHDGHSFPRRIHPNSRSGPILDSILLEAPQDTRGVAAATSAQLVCFGRLRGRERESWA